MKNRLKIRKKNLKLTTLGFTLIELLAIIVILAIIAVITVPIILNIIDNSKKGAAIDSAYGYKDAVNKYYLSKSLDENNFDIPNETYTVNGTTGYLVGTQTLEIQISGKKPDGGAVEMYNNEMKQACLIFGDYAVSINNDTVGDAIKGTCNGTIAASNGSIISIYAHKGDSQKKSVENIAVGDYVTIKDDGFYVIAEPSNGNVLLLSEYNITTSLVWRQKNGDDYKKMAFSESKYWDNHIATVSDPNDCPSATYCNRYDYTTEEWIYIYDSFSNLNTPLQEYKSYLQTIVGTNNITDIRLMSYSEANSIINESWSRNQQYWIGSIQNDSDDDVGYVNTSPSGNRINTMKYASEDSNTVYPGIRPVVEISTNTFGNNQVAIYAVKGDSQTKSSSNIQVGDYVTIGNDGFYVIKQPSNNKVLLLPEYNISQSIPLRETAEWRQTSDSDYNKLLFSESSYWVTANSHGMINPPATVATVSDPSSCPENYYCNMYPNDITYVYDSHSNLYTPIMNYKTYLDSIIGTGAIKNIRIMSTYETYSIRSNPWAHNQEYWTGSSGKESYYYCETGGLYSTVYAMDLNGEVHCNEISEKTNGIRPLVEISLSAF